MLSVCAMLRCPVLAGPCCRACCRWPCVFTQRASPRTICMPCVFSCVLLMCVGHDQGGVAPVMRVLLAQMDVQEAELLAIERSLLQHTV